MGTYPQLASKMDSKLAKPEVIDDLLLYRINRLLSTGGAAVIRMCEGQLGIDRKSVV